jgi:hypothetical protein
VKFLIASSFAALLASAPAFAADTTIFASSEAPDSVPAAESQSISLEGFNGGVSTADTHDAGGGGMMIQMLMSSTGSAAAATPGPYVAHVAVTNTH